VAGDGEGISANLGSLFSGVSHPRVRERVARLRGEGEVVEAGDGAAKSSMVTSSAVRIR